MLENVKLIRAEFPDAAIWIYIATDVPEQIRQSLTACPAVRLIDVPRMSGSINALYRFFAIDDPLCDCMIVRDADSRVHARDASCIRQFLESDKTLHIIRDHWGGHKFPISAGMWGMKKGSLPVGIRMIDLVNAYGENMARDQFLLDQAFLRDIIYPACVGNAVLQDAYGFFEPLAMRTPFLTERSTHCFIGKREEVGPGPWKHL
jgi:hypothetical protein